MDIEEDDCWDTAVLWPATTVYDDQGQPVRSTPVELAWPNGCRWVPSTRQVMDAKGNLINLDATVVVLQDIPVNSLMWLGELADWYGTGSGASDDGLMVVKSFNKTSSQDGRFERRTVSLMRFKNRG
jgi:hypothetical protein